MSSTVSLQLRSAGRLLFMYRFWTSSTVPGLTKRSQWFPSSSSSSSSSIVNNKPVVQGMKTTSTVNPKPVYDNEEENVLKKVLQERKPEELTNLYEKPVRKCILCDHGVVPNYKNTVTKESTGDYTDFHDRRLRFQRVVEKAEDVLGYRLHRLNNSFLRGSQSRSQKNQNSLFEDEAKVVLSSLKKLEGSDHPLLSYAKGINPGCKDDSEILTSSIQLRAMVVLLVAKSFEFSNKLQTDLHESIEALQAKQRSLAEITEMIYTADMIHRTVVEIPKGQLTVLGEVGKYSSSEDSEPRSKGASLHHGNKLATLMGDLLLARTSMGLSNLKNAKVTVLMSDTIADFAESGMIVSLARESLGLKNSDMTNPDVSNPVPQNVGSILNYEMWLRRSNLSIGSLLGNSCFSSLILGGHGQEDEMSKLASAIGFKIGLALQAFKDYTIFEYDESSNVQPRRFDLCSLPVIFHLERNPRLLSTADCYQMHEEVRTSPFAMVKTKETLLVLLHDVHSLLSKLPSSPSARVLNEFLLSLS